MNITKQTVREGKAIKNDIHKILKNKYRSFSVNFNSLKSIAKAERIKSRLENLGYNRIRMTPTGYDKFIMVYKKC
jgi:hypothetical protein